MAGIGTASGFVQAVGSRLHGRKSLKRRRRPRRQGPRFEVLEPRLLLSASATFATSALADYGAKPPALMMPLTAGTGGTKSSVSSLSLSAQTSASNAGQSSLTNAGVTQPPAYAFKTLANFGGTDGSGPFSGLVMDSAGNLFGTTSGGGTGGTNGDGTVFKLAPDGTLTTLVNFNGTDGADPLDTLIMDSAGNLYGMTSAGGAYGYGNGGLGDGTVFKVAPDGTLTTLVNFNGTDGAGPQGAALIMDSAGNLYGTTSSGGTSGDGTVFKLTPSGTLTTLVNFNGADGANPFSGLIMDGAGNLYGTTVYGGTGFAGASTGQGTVFKLAPDGTLTTLVNFSGADGANPYSGLMMDSAGSLYSATNQGGTSNDGTVFKLAPDGTLTTLANFNGTDGANPFSSLIMDSAGNLYGTTGRGGAYGYSNFSTGDGTVFKLSPDGTLTTLANFNGTDGSWLDSGLVVDYAGNLYGTTAFGGTNGDGTVFELSPSSTAIVFTSPTSLGTGTLALGPGGGTLQAGATGVNLPNAISLNDASPPDVYSTGSASYGDTLSGVISGAGGLEVTGGGTLTLTNSDTYTGPTDVNSGTLTLGSGGTLNGTSGLTIDTGATLNLNNTAAGNGVVINYGSGSSPNSVIQSYVGGGQITAPSGYTIGYADGADGVASGVANGQEKIMATLPGDATLSGKVTLNDFTIWINHYGTSSGAQWDQGDFDHDGKINLADFTLFLNNYGQAVKLTAQQPLAAASSSSSTTSSLPSTVAGANEMAIPASLAGGAMSASSVGSLLTAQVTGNTAAAIASPLVLGVANGVNQQADATSGRANLLGQGGIYGAVSNSTLGAAALPEATANPAVASVSAASALNGNRLTVVGLKKKLTLPLSHGQTWAD